MAWPVTRRAEAYYHSLSKAAIYNEGYATSNYDQVGCIYTTPDKMPYLERSKFS